jgi:hypothetical protein
MRRIGRQAVVATSVAIATPINAVFAVMASLTQALKLTEPELVPRSAMRHNVVGDRRRRHAILFQASGAERLDRQLMLCPATPALEAVPRPPRTLRRIKSERRHSLKIAAPFGSG